MRNLLTAIGIIVLGFCLALIVANSLPEPGKVVEPAPPPITVNVLPADTSAKSIYVSSHGIIEAKNTFDLTNEVSGRIVSVAEQFIAGGYFGPWEPLLEISKVSYQAAVANAKAELAEARQELASEKAQAEQAKKEWKDLGSEAANNLFLRKPQLASAQAREQAAESALQRAEYELGLSTVMRGSPLRIVETYAGLGQFVPLGGKLARVYATDSLQVSLPLTQRQLALLDISWPLQDNEALPRIELYAEVGANSHQWQATPKFSAATIDDSNQVARLMASVNSNKSVAALPGLYVEARIWSQPMAGIVEVPESAFHDKQYLLVANDDNKVEFRSAQFVSRNKDKLLLKSDIRSGERVIIDHISLAAPGMLVKPISETTETGNSKAAEGKHQPTVDHQREAP